MNVEENENEDKEGRNRGSRKYHTRTNHEDPEGE